MKFNFKVIKPPDLITLLTLPEYIRALYLENCFLVLHIFYTDISDFSLNTNMTEKQSQ